MSQRARPPKPTWMAWLFSCLLIGMVLGGYVAVAHFTVGSEVPENNLQADRRDTIYFAIHAGGLLVAMLAGFALGKFLNGLGLAYGLLFCAVVAAVMATGQVAAYQAACSGQNDIIRHWTC